MRKHMKIKLIVAIITSAMVLAGSMAACGNSNTDTKDAKIATVSDASETEEDIEAEDTKTTTEVADAKDSKDASDTKDSKDEATTAERKTDTSTTEAKKTDAKPDSKADTKTDSKSDSKTDTKPSTTQAPSNSGNSSSGGNSKPGTTQATTEAPKKEHSWTTSWTPKTEKVKIADEFTQPEYGSARHCRDCGNDSLASTWNGQTCPICGGTSNYGSAPDLPTGNYITEPAVYEDQIVGYTLTLKCSNCGETRTFECDKNQNGNIDYSGYCKK